MLLRLWENRQDLRLEEWLHRPLPACPAIHTCGLLNRTTFGKLLEHFLIWVDWNSAQYRKLRSVSRVSRAARRNFEIFWKYLEGISLHFGGVEPFFPSCQTYVQSIFAALFQYRDHGWWCLAMGFDVRRCPEPLPNSSDFSLSHVSILVSFFFIF